MKNVNSIVYEGERLELFYHSYNCGTQQNIRTTERSVELAVANHWLSKNKGVVEIGAVSPYYNLGVNSILDIVDPADEHPKVNIKDTLFNYSLINKDVLSISTIEHVGTGDYNNTKEENPIKALEKIIVESRKCLITIPLGYNKMLDEYLQTGFANMVSEYALKTNIYFRNKEINNWRQTSNLVAIDMFSYGPLAANAVLIIEKNNFYNLITSKAPVDSFTKELAYMKYINNMDMYPYYWRHSYSYLDVVAYTDEECGLHFVIHNGRKLYFPKTMNLNDVRKQYSWILMENDHRSPHRYTNSSFDIEKGDILLDIGAAEAFVALDNIDIVEHAYIVEVSLDWLYALEQTFAPYRSKVTIINKFADRYDDEDHIRIDSVLQYENKNVFVKIDTEGAERLVVEGMQNLLHNNRVKIAICTYHRDEDAEYFQKYFQHIGYQTQFTNGYLVVPSWQAGIALFGEPSLRKGVMRSWKEEYFSVSSDNIDIFENESWYKQIADINRQRTLLADQVVFLGKDVEQAFALVKRQRRHKQRYKYGMILSLGLAAMVYLLM